MRNPVEKDYRRWTAQIAAIQREVECDVPEGQYPSDLECALRLAWLAAYNGAKGCKRAARDGLTL